MLLFMKYKQIDDEIAVDYVEGVDVVWDVMELGIIVEVSVFDWVCIRKWA